MPEERLLKMTPTNLQKQKEIQLAAKQKKVELDAAKTKKAEVEAKQRKIDAENCSKVRKSDSGPVKTKKTEHDGQKQIKPEVCVLRSGTPPVGVKRPSSSSVVGGGKSAGSYSKRGTKRGLGEGECTIKEVRLNVQRLKKLKSRSTSESSSASGQSSEDLSTRVKRRPQRAAALVHKVKLEDDDVNEGVSEKSFKRKKPISKARASTPDVPMKRQEPEESNDLRGPAFGSEIELPLPESLKNLLVDDFDLISRQRKTLMLPANINVADFLQSFSEEGEESEKVNVDEVCRGLCSYFDSTLGTQLLYKFERVQYSDIMKVLFSWYTVDKHDVLGASWCADVKAVPPNPPVAAANQIAKPSCLLQTRTTSTW